MENIVAIQRWLYSGMASGLADVAGGNTYAIVAAITAAILFGAVHALMPGHGNTVLVSYHLGQSAKLREGVANGAILALTHVGLALVLVSPSSVGHSLMVAARRNSRSQVVR